jgi:hypothetical protein
MTTTTTHRTRHRGDRTDDGDVGNEAERAAAGALAHRFAELGEVVTMAECHETLARIERQGIADLYLDALNMSVGIKQNRQKRRELRRRDNPKTGR